MGEITLELNRSRIGFVLQTAVSSPLASGQAATTKPTIFQQMITVVRPSATASHLARLRSYLKSMN